MRPIIFIATSLLVTSTAWADKDQDAQFSAWAKSMASPSFPERQAAQEGIKEWAAKNIKTVDPLLDNLFANHLESAEPEVRIRCLKLMEKIVLDRKASLGYGYLGVMTLAAERNIGGKVTTAAKITYVYPGTPAQKGGLKADDHIYGLDDHMFSTSAKLGTEQLSDHVKAKVPGEKMLVHIDRNGELLQKTVTLADYVKATAMHQNQVRPQQQLLLQQGMPLQQFQNLLPKGQLQGGNLKLKVFPGQPGQAIPKGFQLELEKQLREKMKDFRMELKLKVEGLQVAPLQPKAKEEAKEEPKAKEKADKATVPKQKKDGVARQIAPRELLNELNQARKLQARKLQADQALLQALNGRQVMRLPANRIVQMGGNRMRSNDDLKIAANENYFKRWYDAKLKVYNAKNKS